VLDPSLSVVAKRFARQLAVFTGPSSRLSGEPGIGGCEMADADELERCDPLGSVSRASSRCFRSPRESSCSRTRSSRA
jgi:hypothetical protein